VIGRAALAVATLLLAAPSPAAAEDVSGAQLVALAAAAVDSDAVRERLLAVHAVDGRPVAMRFALAGARGDEIVTRARLIADLSPGPQADAPAAARAEAHAVLDDRRFKGAGLPRPLQKPLA
jgi:hypothetical protein